MIAHTWEHTYESTHMRAHRRRKMPDPDAADSVLCETAQSKRTWTFHKSHFAWKFTGKMPDPHPTTWIEHRALTVTVRTPSVRPHCLGKQRQVSSDYLQVGPYFPEVAFFFFCLCRFGPSSGLLFSFFGGAYEGLVTLTSQKIDKQQTQSRNTAKNFIKPSITVTSSTADTALMTFNCSCLLTPD